MKTLNTGREQRLLSIKSFRMQKFTLIKETFLLLEPYTCSLKIEYISHDYTQGIMPVCIDLVQDESRQILH